MILNILYLSLSNITRFDQTSTTQQFILVTSFTFGQKIVHSTIGATLEFKHNRTTIQQSGQPALITNDKSSYGVGLRRGSFNLFGMKLNRMN